MLQRALAAADLLAAQGINAGILHMHTVKPLDVDALGQAIRGVKLLVSLEEHVPTGGLGSAIAEGLIDRLGHGLPAMLRLSLPDAFMHNYGSQDSLMKKHDLAPASIAAAIRRAVAAPGVPSSQLHST
jgi:transketolase